MSGVYFQMEKSVLLVYVQLGANPSPTLLHYAGVNTQNLMNVKNVLITNDSKRYIEFPGDVIDYQNDNNWPGFDRYADFNLAYSNIAGGYWRFTMERLFALGVLRDHYSNDMPVIHVESDVLLMLDDKILDNLIANFKKTSVPRYSENDGIASILFSPSIEQLISDLHELDLILSKNLRTQSDMSLLGLGLNNSVLGELPTLPGDSLSIGSDERPVKTNIVFDGAAYGQYLFGQDPVHSSNRTISGYQNPKFPLTLSELRWMVSGSGTQAIRPTYEWQGEVYELANIHMHSKREVDPTDLNQWETCLGEANGEIERLPGDFVPDLIHTIRSSLKDRLRIMLRRGIFRSIVKGLIRRAKGWVP